MIDTGKKRLGRTMMFLSAQKPRLIRDLYTYRPDPIMLDLKDAMAENQRSATRFSLYHVLKTIDYRGCGRVVRINGLNTSYWKEDIQYAMAGGCDVTRIPKTERLEDVRAVEDRIGVAEKEFGIPEGCTLIMAAIELARGVMRVLNVCEASEWLSGIAFSGGDYTKGLQTHITGTGAKLMDVRRNMTIAARVVGVQCFSTVYTNLDDMEGFRRDVETIHLMGFSGKSIISPRQITIVHEIFTPTPKDIILTEKMVKETDNKKTRGIGMFMVGGKMIDTVFYDGTKGIIALVKTSGIYKRDL